MTTETPGHRVLTSSRLTGEVTPLFWSCSRIARMGPPTSSSLAEEKPPLLPPSSAQRARDLPTHAADPWELLTAATIKLHRLCSDHRSGRFGTVRPPAWALASR